jgi:hypothetical protein
MASIFFDESGYTGRNLLDPSQPHFVIASSRVDDLESARILADIFPRFKGVEVKFKDVWRRYKDRLLPLCEALGERASDLYLWQVDKKFCVLQKLIDYLVEPVAYRAGYDFYKNAHAYKYSNYVYFGLNRIAAPELYDSTVQAFYEFASEPHDASLSRLVFRLRLFASSAPAEMKFFFDIALQGALKFHEHSNIKTFKDSLEIYITSMLNCVGFWSQNAKEDLDLYHDRASVFFSQKDLWNALISKKVSDQLHPVANGPPIRFPLPVGSTNSLDSKSNKAIQICDLLAGLMAKLCNSLDGSERELIDRIKRTKFNQIAMNGLQPSLEFPENGPELRDGPDPVDRMVGIIREGQT